LPKIRVTSVVAENELGAREKRACSSLCPSRRDGGKRGGGGRVRQEGGFSFRGNNTRESECASEMSVLGGTAVRNALVRVKESRRGRRRERAQNNNSC